MKFATYTQKLRSFQAFEYFIGNFRISTKAVKHTK